MDGTDLTLSLLRTGGGDTFAEARDRIVTVVFGIVGGT